MKLNTLSYFKISMVPEPKIDSCRNKIIRNSILLFPKLFTGSIPNVAHKKNDSTIFTASYSSCKNMNMDGLI